jgi:hypothetical protein
VRHRRCAVGETKHGLRFTFSRSHKLSSEALLLPEALEGIMGWSKLVVMVEEMFIDKSGGSCHRCRVCRARRREGVGRHGLGAGPSILIYQQPTRTANPPYFSAALTTVRRLPALLYTVLDGRNRVYDVFLW